MLQPCTHTLAILEEKFIDQLLALQQQNLGSNLSAEECEREGFVSSVHTKQLLEFVCKQAPSIIAFNEKRELVGYTLSFPLSVRRQVVESNVFLAPFFDLLEKLADSFGGSDKVIMGGQLCVAKSERGQGLAVKLLRQQQAMLSQLKYTVVITEVYIMNALTNIK
jgi:hypothetical protein